MARLLKEQMLVLSLGLIAVAAVLVYVPFEATYAQRGENARARVGYALVWSPPSPVEVCVRSFGMRASSRQSVQDIVREANRRCYVRPVYSQAVSSAIAITFLTLGLLLILKMFRHHGEQVFTQHVAQPGAAPVKSDAMVTTSSPLRDQLGAYIEGGTGKRDDPFVISEKRDYVALEYAIGKHVMTSSDIEYTLEEQRLHQVKGRAIDELVYAVKPRGSTDWTHRRRLFFDITAGFHGHT